MKIKNWVKKQWKQINSTPPVLVLMYHRVINSSLDPWNLVVSPQNFEQHLEILKASKLVLPLSNIKGINQKKPNSTIFITFDDGYMDNFLYAKPILEAYDLPATFFISTKHLGTKKSFWWDELTYIILESPILPDKLVLNYRDSIFSFDLKNEIILTEKFRHLYENWNATLPPPGLRAQLYLDLWRLLSTLDYQEQQLIMKKLREWAGINSKQLEFNNISMEKPHLQSLSSNPLFQIGGHTNSHPLLPQLNEVEQEKEICENKQFLESAINSPIDSFAYPSGKFDQNTLEILKSQGFETAFTTKPRLIKYKADPLLFGRFQVNNWSGKEFQQQLENWMS
ncbi:polysaccharide deacetylase family protein [Cyclobacterium sp. 1_MG-2023]|uniref:polysaccharide deacetylase family protein n=1 Tax=Cyclobacterium sp. 1_MG-2023 TaxID=3062681 RepID=UPI0026E319B5|nr:polysaccharide deacetylase family protein [Cyclobacterium sp. 1_MG-2023]MDO6436229.1 polysaccharide deacetylase family protein [Cyclobacterium sp. 1_MG-2023]